MDSMKSPPPVAPEVEPVTFNPGDLVFLSDGRRCEYIAPHRSEHIVRPGFVASAYGDEDEPGEYFEGALVVDVVFREAPLPSIDARFAELSAEVDQRRAALDQLRADEAQLDRDAKARKAKFAARAALRHIEDFIDGRFTHCVVADGHGSVSVAAKDAALKRGDDNYDRDLKLVSLFGRSNGDLEWRRNMYYDGSGSWTTIVPCASEAEAIAEAGKMLDGLLAEHVAKSNIYALRSAIGSADKLGHPVPDAAREMLLAADLADRESRVASCEKALADARAALAQARSVS